MARQLAQRRDPEPQAPEAQGARGSAKHRAIIDAATEVFLSVGYGPAGMDAIARRAGVAKQTIYNHFGSKDALFGEIITELCDSLLTPLRSLDSGGQGLQATLLSLARRYCELMLAPASLALHRLLVAEAPRFPELGAISYRAGGVRAIETLARYLERQNRAGALAVRDTRLAAEQFYGMLTGYIQVRALLGVEPRPSAEALERALREAVRTFLAAHRP